MVLYRKPSSDAREHSRIRIVQWGTRRRPGSEYLGCLVADPQLFACSAQARAAVVVVDHRLSLSPGPDAGCIRGPDRRLDRFETLPGARPARGCDRPGARRPEVGLLSSSSFRFSLRLMTRRREGRRDIDRVKALMASWDCSDRATWAEFAQFDPDRAYTRNLIATDNENFTLMMLCWNKGRFRYGALEAIRTIFILHALFKLAHYCHLRIVLIVSVRKICHPSDRDASASFYFISKMC